MKKRKKIVNLVAIWKNPYDLGNYSIIEDCMEV